MIKCAKAFLAMATLVFLCIFLDFAYLVIFELEEQEMNGIAGNSARRKEKNKEVTSSGSFCSILRGNEAIPSAAHLWRKYTSLILSSSEYGRVYDHDFAAKLMNIITPQRLQAAMKALPKTNEQWEAIGDMLDIAFKRWEFMEERKRKWGAREHYKEEPNEPRKVNVLVFGGSVTLGVECFRNHFGNNKIMNYNKCAWPSRLDNLLNKFFGHNMHDVVEIRSLAMGGTNTNIGTLIWDFTLFPGMTMPDIVIHAYATNDMHILSMKEAKNRGITLEQSIFETNQKFIRSILTPKIDPLSTCNQRPPFLIYYDDYIGNEQRKILDTTDFSKALNILSSYYDFSLLSYADAVKDIVYSDTSKEWLSPHLWLQRQIHPGLGMHIASSWLFAYQFLHLATNYCALYDFAGNNTLTNASNNIYTNAVLPRNKDYRPTTFNGLPQLKQPGITIDRQPQIYDHPRSQLRGNFSGAAIPPNLDDSLTLDNISDKWLNETTIIRNNKFLHKPQCNAHDRLVITQQCIFSWVGNLGNLLKPTQLENKLHDILLVNDG